MRAMTFPNDNRTPEPWIRFVHEFFHEMLHMHVNDSVRLVGSYMESEPRLQVTMTEEGRTFVVDMNLRPTTTEASIPDIPVL
eukprot:1796359-Pleurochrysis_carterae.AAC.1